MGLALSTLSIILGLAVVFPYLLVRKGKLADGNRCLKFLVISVMFTLLISGFLTVQNNARAAMIGYTLFYIFYSMVIFGFYRFVIVFCTNRNRDVFTTPSFYGLLIIVFMILYNLYSHNLFTVKQVEFRGSVFPLSLHQNMFFLYYLFVGIEAGICSLYLIQGFIKSARIYKARYVVIFLVAAVFLLLDYLSFIYDIPDVIKSIFLFPEMLVHIYIVVFYSQRSLTKSVLQFAVDNQSDGLMIYNENDHLIYSNKTIFRLLTPDQLKMCELYSNVDAWAMDQVVVNGLTVKPVEIEGKTVYLEVDKHRFNDKTAYIGTSFTFTDVTDSVERLELMEKANAELVQAAHMKSDFLANMSHEIRTPMNAVIGLAEMSLREEMTDQARDYISQIKSSGRGLLNIINDILDFSKIESGKMDIIPESYEPFSEFNDVANTLVNRIGEKDLELTVEENPNIPCRLEGDVLRIRQILINLANNAIKFTQKGRVQIVCDYDSISEDEVMLNFHVVDTGMGIKPDDLKKLFVSFQQVDSKRNRSIEGTGLGLAISKSLVEAMGGSIGVDSEYGKGSDFYFSIPQKIIDPMPSVSVNDPESIFAMGMFSRKYLARRFFIDSSRMGVYSAVLRYVDDYDATIDVYDEMIADKRKYLFFEEGDYNEGVKDILERDPSVTGIMITEFTSAAKPDLDNLRIVKKPFSTAAIAMALNAQEIRFDSDESQAFVSDFTAPGAEILIVDDNPVNLTVAEGLLEPLKMNVTSALSGKKALELLEEKHFDIVFMDHMMPELDGVETTRIIRRMHPELDSMPIIALTANAIGGAKEFFLREGMNDFVPKPIEIRDIMVKVKKWLPPEMIVKGTNVVDIDENSENNEKIDIPGLECDKAISMVGTAALYMKILKEYYKNIKPNHEQLALAYANEDWENYTIKVHALKSSSRQIGAMDLSEKAAALEAAGKSDDIEYIRNNSDEALTQYIGLIDILKDYCESEEDNIEKEQISGEMLEDIMTRAVAASDDLDMDAMEGIVEELGKYDFSDDITPLVDNFKESAELMDVFTCKEIAEKILDMLA